jgi:hypothetical protein
MDGSRQSSGEGAGETEPRPIFLEKIRNVKLHPSNINLLTKVEIYVILVE